MSDIGSRLTDLGSGRYTEYVTRTTHAVLESKGVTEPRLRWAIFHRRLNDIPANLHAYVEKVRQHAYKVTDADVEALHQAGYNDDAIFEVTASAALGAAIARLERGLIAVHESAS